MNDIPTLTYLVTMDNGRQYMVTVDGRTEATN